MSNNLKLKIQAFKLFLINQIKLSDLLCLDLGVEPLRFIVIRKRLIYLQHILKQNKSSLVRQFLMTHSINPRKKDWVTTVKEDLKQLEIDLTFVQIEEMGKFTYKRLIKKKTKESAFKYLIIKITQKWKR